MRSSMLRLVTTTGVKKNATTQMWQPFGQGTRRSTKGCRRTKTATTRPIVTAQIPRTLIPIIGGSMRERYTCAWIKNKSGFYLIFTRHSWSVIRFFFNNYSNNYSYSWITGWIIIHIRNNAWNYYSKLIIYSWHTLVRTKVAAGGLVVIRNSESFFTIQWVWINCLIVQFNQVQLL